MPHSREVQALIDFVEATGLPHRVTDVSTPGVHSNTSYHYADGTGGKGLAIDLAGAIPGTSKAMVEQMSALWRAFRPVAPKLAELFFQGPGIHMVVKNGAWRPGLQTLGQRTWDAHKTHVHVAVKRGVFLPPASPIAAAATPTVQPAVMVPAPVHDYEEATTKTMLVHIGPLDGNGRGWADWQPGLGRDPIPISALQHGPSPPDDGYWETQEKVNISAQPRGGSLRITVRNGKPGDTVTVWATVA
jgi:hypothetical protein